MHAKAQNTMPIFIENQFYHVYNRANGDDKLFYTEANYLYFLAKLNSIISSEGKESNKPDRCNNVERYHPDEIMAY